MAQTTSIKKPINLLRGWPSPDLLPAKSLRAAAERLLSDPELFVPALQYGPDLGYQPLREELARWLGNFYDFPPDPARICITGGASQNLACILQSFTDPGYTKAIWMVAPSYFLAAPIFEDSGFEGRLRAVPEDENGIDLDYLENGLERMRDDDSTEPVCLWLSASIIYPELLLTRWTGCAERIPGIQEPPEQKIIPTHRIHRTNLC